jgi:hypothetical protein
MDRVIHGSGGFMTRFQCYLTVGEQVQWRLLGGNNRVLGTSIHTLPDHSSALEEIGTVRQRVQDAAFDLERVPSGLWWWRMRLGDVDFARSATGFLRRVDAVRSSERFRRTAGEALPDRTLAVFEPGRRGREITFDGGTDSTN